MLLYGKSIPHVFLGNIKISGDKFHNRIILWICHMTIFFNQYLYPLKHQKGSKYI